MEKLVLFFVMCVCVRAAAHYKHHPRFPRGAEEDEKPHLKKVACTRETDDVRNAYVEESKCGAPRDTFVHLTVSAHKQITPGAVWVKRCEGLCDLEYGSGAKCVATVTVVKQIPVRIFNAKTDKEICSTYSVEEHVSCGCCAITADECKSPRVFNPRKCSCTCPNTAERRSCLLKRSPSMRWNRYKCACEGRRKT